MRPLTTIEGVRRFMLELGKAARASASVYFTGGVTALFYGWRPATIDIDLKIVPDSDEVLRALPRLKEALGLNLELAAPDQFIPELPGWRERSPFIAQQGNLSFFHYDLYAQALSKIERGHNQDIQDVHHMLEGEHIDPEQLVELFRRIEPALYRYPAIDPASFREKVLAAVGQDR